MPPSNPIVTANTTHTAPENRAYFPALDGVRAVAFLLVFAHHYMGLEVGWVGVDIFFVLSGFLITGILYDTRDSPHRVRNFYIRRSLRIFPLYYAVFLLILLAAPIQHWQWDWRWLSWPLYVGNLTLFVHQGPLDTATICLSNGWLRDGHGSLIFIGHFWSLCVEEQFYLIWPWIVFKVTSRKTLVAISTTVIVIGPLLRQFATVHLPADRVAAGLTVHGTPFRLDTLMVGALVALLFRGNSRQALFKASKISIWIASTITGSALVAFILHPSLLHNRAFKPMLFTIGLTVIALFAATLITRCLIPGTIFTRILSNSVLRWLGRISYGAYVFHDILHPFYAHLSERSHIPTPLIGIVVTFTLAWLSFRFYESPFLDLKQKFTVLSRPPGQAAPTEGSPRLTDA